MSRNPKAAASGKMALPKISAQLHEELIPGPVTKEQFEDIFQSFKKDRKAGTVSAMVHSMIGSPGAIK